LSPRRGCEWGGSVLNESLLTITADEDGVQSVMPGPVLLDGRIHRIRDDLTSESIYYVKYVGYSLAASFRYRLAGWFFNNCIKKRYIPIVVRTDDTVADGVERNLSAFPFLEQAFLKYFAPTGIAQGTHQLTRFDLALDKIV
jgi:hypothetical protein